MGIKYLPSYLEDHPRLKHMVHFNRTERRRDGRNLLIWDALGWLHRCFGSHDRATKLLFDFKVLDAECQRIVAAFQRFGFEVVAFIDGYFCRHKVGEKRKRKRRSLNSVRKYVETLHELHRSPSLAKRRAIEKKLKFVPSTIYPHVLEQALSRSGCRVHRGSGLNDIDQDIARFAAEHRRSVYGVISCDSDYFGFFDLPKELKLITAFHAKSRRLSLTFYRAAELWSALGLHRKRQRLELISVVGNDFVPKRSPSTLLRRCGLNPDRLTPKSVCFPIFTENPFDFPLWSKRRTL